MLARGDVKWPLIRHPRLRNPMRDGNPAKISGEAAVRDQAQVVSLGQLVLNRRHQGGRRELRKWFAAGQKSQHQPESFHRRDKVAGIRGYTLAHWLDP